MIPARLRIYEHYEAGYSVSTIFRNFSASSTFILERIVFKKINQKKIELLIYLIAIFILILVSFGFTNIYRSNKIIREQANKNLIYRLEKIKYEADIYFSKAEDSVEDCKEIVEISIDKEKLDKIAPSVYKYDKNKLPYLQNYIDSKLSPALLFFASRAESVMSIYLTFDPEFLKHRSVIGLWYMDKNLDNKFVKADNGLTRTMYPENREDLEWFYQPKKLKRGIWSPPYTDDDIKVDMITYSAPVYAGKKFIGVIGIDISMDKIKNFIYKFKLCKTGKAYVIDENNKVIYSKDYKPLTDTSSIDKNLHNCLNKTCAKDTIDLNNKEIRLIKSASGKNLFAITKLYNNFFLVIEISTKELYKDTDKLIVFSVYSLILAILIALLIAIEAYTRIKKINNQLMHKEKLISMGTMAAEIAHEINNPLGYVNCNIDTLKKFIDKLKKFMFDCDTQFKKVLSNEISVETEIQNIQELKKEHKLNYVLESLDEIINETKDGIKKVSEIVLDLKNFAKDDSQNIKSNENVEKIINEAFLILGGKIPTDIQIIRDFTSIPELSCNKNQLKQVLINMIDNACYSIEQKGHDNKFIRVATYKENNNACIEIDDNGMGIEKNKLSKIFDSFYTTKDYGEGTGLGLTIAYEIITQKHKGQILVESQKGKGTKFLIKIPYK